VQRCVDTVQGNEIMRHEISKRRSHELGISQNLSDHEHQRVLRRFITAVHLKSTICEWDSNAF
jgi:hypothetical protein